MNELPQPKSQNNCQSMAGKPIRVDVLAKVTGKGLQFSHNWRFEDGGPQSSLAIEVPRRKKGDPATPIRFHLIDNTKRKLRFDDADPIWVDRNCCPEQGMYDAEIPVEHIKPCGTTLFVIDLNNEQCTLYYNLRFRDEEGIIECYDPEIKNGGIGL